MKERKSIYFILLFTLTGYISCVKDFIPHIEKYDQLLVVEGSITDQPGPYTVRLSISGSVKQKPINNPYSKCTVEIADDVGNSETLIEVSEGVYKTDSLGIKGIVGRKYKLKITSPDGQSYESQEEILKKGVGIQSVNAEYEHKNDKDGYQFYVDAENYSEADNNYFFWSLESTYKFKTDYKIFFYYEGGSVIKPFPNPDSLQTGYRTQQIPEIYTFNPVEQNQKQIIHFPLYYEDTYSKALTIRYCLTLNQYTVNEKQYTYWNTLKKMNASQGALYSQQPYQIKGNVININNPDMPVLGYFMVAGASQKRIFVNPLPLGMYHYPTCGPPGLERVSLINRLKYQTKPSDWPLYIAPSTETFPGSGICKSGVIVGLESDRDCADCRANGFLQKPYFWID